LPNYFLILFPISIRIPQLPEKTLDAPCIVADNWYNLLDWGRRNVIAVALDDTVYLWNATKESTSELVTVSEASSPVSSVSWAPDGCRIAIGGNSSTVDLYDATTNKLVCVTNLILSKNKKNLAPLS